MRLRRGRKSLSATPYLRIEALETRALLNGNSVLDVMQPRLKPPPGHEPAFHARLDPSPPSATEDITLVTVPPVETEVEVDSTLDQTDIVVESSLSVSTGNADSEINNDNTDDGNEEIIRPPLNENTSGTPTKDPDRQDAHSTPTNGAGLNTTGQSTVSVNANAHATLDDSTSVPSNDSPLDDQTPTVAPVKPPVVHPPKKVLPETDVTDPLPNDERPQRPGDETPAGDHHHDARPPLDPKPELPDTPFTPAERPIPATYWPWAQAVASRGLALAMLGVTHAASHDMGSSWGTTDSAGPEAEAGVNGKGAATENDDLLALDTGAATSDDSTRDVLLAGSLTPQQSEMLGAVLALDVDALGEGVMQFFQKLDRLGNELLSTPEGVGLSPWLLAVLVTGTTLELVRRRRKAALVPELAGVTQDLSWTWSLGLNDPAERE